MTTSNPKPQPEKADSPVEDPSRRRLLTSSAAAALALAGGMWVYQSKDERVIEEDLVALIDTPVFDIHTQHLLAHVCSAVLSPMLPETVPARAERINRCLHYSAGYCAGLPDYLQEEVGQLFELMKYPPSRYLITSEWKSPIGMSDEQLLAMLEKMQFGDIRLQRRAFTVFRDVVMAGYYGDRSSWSELSYPGPIVDFKQNG